MNRTEPVVLIADDGETDQGEIRSIFQGAGFSLPPQFTRGGDEAMAYLRGDGDYRNRSQFPLPCILVMEVEMLRKNGHDVLAWQQGQTEQTRLPVYLLSAASRPEDIERAYDLGPHAYLVKPCSLDALDQMAKQLFTWLKTNRLAA